ncbi:BTB/POZ domain-containing protein KCTD9-like [Tubulanus polymorphus]|uniref:BTB/POZ domain-containing protein KCTD9-like n=1 Tax=Tubulanus polymorphus TaxID=672921 RepID=UPI003DA38DC3
MLNNDCKMSEKIVTIFPQSSNNCQPGVHSGKVIAIDSSWNVTELLNKASEKLQINALQIFNCHRGLIDDINLIRDGEILYFSNVDDAFTEKCTVLPETLSGDWVVLNVGGKKFTTTRDTLVNKEPESMLARMFDNSTVQPWSSRVDSDGAYLIDRSATYFEPILNYLRHGELILDKNVNPSGVLEEAKFYGIMSLIDKVNEIIECEKPKDDITPIERREFTLALMCTPSNCELRCQGLSFRGANLSRLDLRYINFKYAKMQSVNFCGANLAYCNFERADLSKAKFDGSTLLGVKFMCANLEGASLKGCNFEDPAGSRASMEGANLKCVNLEGSHMAAVNLRVATLKNANLQNCDLRAAVLAGADLENCDLSGCDLQEANLRGANLKGATFELMLNPLHMSQTIR